MVFIPGYAWIFSCPPSILRVFRSGREDAGIYVVSAGDGWGNNEPVLIKKNSK
jgi:hypothetical protein